MASLAVLRHFVVAIFERRRAPENVPFADGAVEAQRREFRHLKCVFAPQTVAERQFLRLY